jgi:hypothetical protein
MHEYWLQKYIKEHYPGIGFTQLHGPYSHGADFKGVYAGRPVKIEAEWAYSDYLSHEHGPGFADILVVATLKPAPEALKGKLPSIIINLNREQVVDWAQPRLATKNAEDFHAYPWRKLALNLLDLYSHYRKLDHRQMDFAGYNLVRSLYQTQTPAGFEFGSGGKELSFTGQPEDKAAWDYWLNIAHCVADHFRLKPALLRPTWIDRVALYFNHTGRITEGEHLRFQEVAVFIDDLIRQDQVN